MFLMIMLLYFLQEISSFSHQDKIKLLAALLQLRQNKCLYILKCDVTMGHVRIKRTLRVRQLYTDWFSRAGMESTQKAYFCIF